MGNIAELSNIGDIDDVTPKKGRKRKKVNHNVRSKELLVENESYKAYFDRGKNYFELEEFEEAIKDFQRSIQLENTIKNKESYLYCGKCLYQIGDTNNALKCFTNFKNMDPKSEHAYNGIGACYLIKGKIDDAIPQFEEAIRINPKNGDIYANLGNCYAFLEKFSDAKKIYDEAVGISRGSAFIRVCYGRFYLRENNIDYAKAQSQFSEANRLDKNNPMILRFLGKCCYYRRNFTSSIQYFTKSLSLLEDAETFIDRGKAYKEINKTLEAHMDYNSALSLEPKNADGLRYRGALLCFFNHDFRNGCRDLLKAASFGVEAASEDIGKVILLLTRRIAKLDSDVFEENFLNTYHCKNEESEGEGENEEEDEEDNIDDQTHQKILGMEKDCELFYNRGLVYLMTKQNQDAQNDFFKYFLSKSIFLEEIKKFDEALLVVHKAMEIHPTSSSTGRRRLKLFKKAKLMIEEKKKLLPNEPVMRSVVFNTSSSEQVFFEGIGLGGETEPLTPIEENEENNEIEYSTISYLTSIRNPLDRGIFYPNKALKFEDIEKFENWANDNNVCVIDLDHPDFGKKGGNEPVDSVKKVDTSTNVVISMESTEYKNLMKSLTCPISCEIMENPVTLVESGNTYERDQILKWIENNDTDPLNRTFLRTKKIVPNHKVKSLISDWKSIVGKKIEE